MLALGLGYVISWSLIGPVKEIEARLKQVATGDFAHRLDIVNRDELGALAADVNKMSEELGRLYQQLEMASKHKSQFLANMSHELRTPLNAILGYTELILDSVYGEMPEKVRSVLDRVQRNGRHLLGLINDVLDLSKIEAGQLTLSLSEYSLKNIIQTVFSAVEPLATQKQIALKIEVAPKLPQGRGDEQRLAQVLLNLVGNAIKFTDSGEVSIKASSADGAFTVAVRDTGPGIATTDQARLFQEFQQADNSITRKKGGTGLGLAISKRIIEMHGGRIWVESTPGHGSTFAFTLAVTVEDPVQTSNGPASSSACVRAAISLANPPNRCWVRPARASAGVQTVCLDHGSARRRSQIRDERLRSFRIFAGCGHPGHVDDLPLNFARERADYIQPAIHQHVDAKHRKIGLATRDRLDDRCGRCLRLGLRPHRLRDPEMLVDI
jgi:signal transduction histidine kinase